MDSKMWVAALWFFQYFETYCTQSALMIGVCTINLSLPECIRLTMHHLSNFQGGSHFQHGHFSCRNTQRFMHRPDKCPLMFLLDKISDQGNGIYMETLRCISPLLQFCKHDQEFLPQQSQQGKSNRKAQQVKIRIFILINTWHTQLYLQFPQTVRELRQILISGTERLGLVTVLSVRKFSDIRIRRPCHHLQICVFSASTTKNS